MTTNLGLWLAAGNVLLDQIGVPVPAVPTLVVAGAYVTGHPVWGIELWLLSSLACLLADAGWYWAGRRYGNGVMRVLCRVSLSPDSCVSETQRRFESWGGKALLFAKFVPGLSIIAPPLAGALRMSAGRFFPLSAAGAGLWVGAYLAVGGVLAEPIRAMLPYAARLGPRAVALVVLALAGYVAFKAYERWRFRAQLRMARISVTELYQLLDAEHAPLILDVRSRSARTLDPRWIPTALHVPPEDIDEYVKPLERDREVVLYCTCPNEASAARVAKALVGRGFRRVRPLHGGLDAWVEAGYPLGAAPDGRAR